MNRERRGYLDRGLAKLGSRKFWMMCVACVALFTGHLDGTEWAAVAGTWAIGQTYLDKLKHGKHV